MYRFHIMLHVRPPEATVGPDWKLAGQTYATIAVDPARRSVPFEVSFEAVAARFETLPGMFIEPDGAFVWRSRGTANSSWQVDGVLYDHDGRLAYVEARGECPAAEYDELLAACGWPATPLMAQLVREAVFLEIDEFRRYATLEARSARG